MILAGDIGGTKTYLGLFKRVKTKRGGKIKTTPPVLEGEVAIYSSKDYAGKGLTAMMQDFLEEASVAKSAIKAIGLGVAGPVINGQCNLTSLEGWLISESDLNKFFGAPVVLINDLEAMGYGIPVLSPDLLEQLNRDEVTPEPENKQPRAIIAAGTGLGEAGLFWSPTEQVFRPFPSEGGHVDFAPCNERQAKLLRYLSEREEFLGHVSYERILSGPGLFNIYQFFRDNQEYGLESSKVKSLLEEEDNKPEEVRNQAAIISKMALSKQDSLCEHSLDEFMSIYGAEAGNLVLKYKALGGIYIAGNIALHNLDKLRDGTFLKAFKNKGRFQNLVGSAPIYVVLDDKVGLLGAAQRASELC